MNYCCSGTIIMTITCRRTGSNSFTLEKVCKRSIEIYGVRLSCDCCCFCIGVLSSEFRILLQDYPILSSSNESNDEKNKNITAL